MGGLIQLSAGLTDVGRKRTSNEDSILLLPNLGVYCVADGMGGVRGGEYASQKTLAVVGESVIREAKGRDLSGRLGVIRAAVNEASSAIKAWADEKGIQGTGTTLVVLLVDPITRRGSVLHAGDSRAYRFRYGRLEPLTKDHSVVSALGMEGGQALSSMFQNLITRAVGLNPIVELDHAEVLIEPGDLYLLCSDGLSKMLSDVELAQVLSAGASGHDVKPYAQALVDAANAHGGEDNISVVLVRCLEEGVVPGGAVESSADTGGRRRTGDRPSGEDAEIIGVTPRSDDQKGVAATPTTPTTPREARPIAGSEVAAVEATRSTAGRFSEASVARPARLSPTARRALVLAGCLLAGAILGAGATARKSGRLGCVRQPVGGTSETAETIATAPLPTVIGMPPLVVTTTTEPSFVAPLSTVPRPPSTTTTSTIRPAAVPATTQPPPISTDTTSSRPAPTPTQSQAIPPTLHPPPPTTTSTTAAPPKRWSAEEIRTAIQSALRDGEWGVLGSQLASGADWRAALDDAGMGRVFRAWHGEWSRQESAAALAEGRLSEWAVSMNALGTRIGAEPWQQPPDPWPVDASSRATRFCRSAYALQLHFLAAFRRFSQRQRDSVALFGTGGEALVGLWSLNGTAKPDREKVSSSLRKLPDVLDVLDRWVQSSRQLPLAPEDAERAVQAYATEAQRTVDHAWQHVLDAILAAPLDTLRSATPRGGEKAKAIEAAIRARAQLFPSGASIPDAVRWRTTADPKDVSALLRMLQELDAMDRRTASEAP